MEISNNMEEKKCPKCNTSNPVAASFCRHCRYEFPEASKNGLSLEPKIAYFRILETQYVMGSTIHLEWVADNFNKLELEGEDVTLYNTADFMVEKAIEIHLVAFNDYAQTQQSIRIIPAPLPQIDYFSSSHHIAMKGGRIRLAWNVSNASRLLLRYASEEKDVTGDDGIELFLDRDTTFTLVAVSFDNDVSIEKQLDVRILEEVGIGTFQSNALQTYETEPVELRWQVDHAEKIILYPGEVDVSKQNRIMVYPSQTTIYRLVASNAISEAEQLITVMVRPLPRVDVNVTNSLSRLQVPAFECDFASLLGSIKETDIDKWLLSPSQQPVYKRIWKNSLLTVMNKVLRKE